MTDDTVTIEIDVSNETVAAEVGYALLGRAQDIHENPDDVSEHIAEELKDLAWTVIDDYE